MRFNSKKRSTKMVSILHSIFIVSFFAVTGLGGQQPLESVVKYTIKEFNSEVHTKNHFILFFVPWNGESKSVAPVWEELGQKYNNRGGDDLVLAKVDCTADVELCAEQNVTDYPTLKFYKFGSENVGGIRFRGVKDFQSLEQFLNSFINPGADPVYGSRVATPPPPLMGLHLLVEENFDGFIQSNGKVFINFCAPWSSRCIDLQNSWPEVSQHFQYDDDVAFGQLDCTMYKSKCNEHKIRGYPSLVWFVDGTLDEKYSKKEMDIESLKNFVYSKLGKKEAPKKNAQDENQYKSPALVMDQDNFYEVLKSEPLIFVNFNTPWCTPCQKLDPIWEELAAYYKYNKKIKIAKVDCTRNKALCEENDIQEFPTLNVYANGELKGPYGGLQNPEELTIFIETLIDNPKEEL